MSLDYAISHADSIFANFSEVTAASYNNPGKQKMTAIMLNGMYDYHNETNITPYMGLGVGLAHLRHDFVYGESGLVGDGGLELVALSKQGILNGDDYIIGGNTSVVRSDDYVFAYQGIVGLAWNLLNNLSMFIDYRFLATAKADLKFNTAGFFAPIDVRGHYTSPRVNIGLTYFL